MDEEYFDPYMRHEIDPDSYACPECGACMDEPCADSCPISIVYDEVASCVS